MRQFQLGFSPWVQFILIAASATAGQSVCPGAVWLDGLASKFKIMAGVICRRNRNYWFGEDRTKSNDPDKRYVSLFKELLNHREQLLMLLQSLRGSLRKADVVGPRPRQRITFHGRAGVLGGA